MIRPSPPGAPAVWTSAKSRVRRRSLFAIRGVPRLRRAISGARLTRLEGVGRLVPEEAPEELARLVHELATDGAVHAPA